MEDLMTGTRQSENGALMCPECGAGPFERSQSLGVHRRRKHGVVGQSATSKRDRKTKRSAPAKAAAPRQYERDQALELVCGGELPKNTVLLGEILEWTAAGERLSEACLTK